MVRKFGKQPCNKISHIQLQPSFSQSGTTLGFRSSLSTTNPLVTSRWYFQDCGFFYQKSNVKLQTSIWAWWTRTSFLGLKLAGHDDPLYRPSDRRVRYSAHVRTLERYSCIFRALAYCLQAIPTPGPARKTTFPRVRIKVKLNERLITPPVQLEGKSGGWRRWKTGACAYLWWLPEILGGFFLIVTHFNALSRPRTPCAGRHWTLANPASAADVMQVLPVWLTVLHVEDIILRVSCSWLSRTLYIFYIPLHARTYIILLRTRGPNDWARCPAHNFLRLQYGTLGIREKIKTKSLGMAQNSYLKMISLKICSLPQNSTQFIFTRA